MTPTGKNFTVATAFMCNEQATTYRWVLQQIKHLYFTSAMSNGQGSAINEGEPLVVLTDRESGLMQGLCINLYKTRRMWLEMVIGFRVVSNFLFGDENHWVEIRRRMSYDLQYRMYVYEQLFSSVERVTELIMKTNWEEGSAPPEYWMNTPDHLYVISTTVLPLVSNMNGPAGTIFIRLIEELQHFIHPFSPLQVQWEYHRDMQVSGWSAPYRNRMADLVTRYSEMYPP
ncbi:hypothetical protein M9H77_25195 [Catharanthus roseus]|uniref:Uncharacterized protein n=1 Tax=Catharanthus roseus TaxID=4058 RepID=A0ACC0A8V9_CATRO|nr:hypothetical protein M9H77_25195 [Catharanthus roseus]